MAQQDRPAELSKYTRNMKAQQFLPSLWPSPLLLDLLALILLYYNANEN
jgi:hypothetical protein